MLQYQPVLTKLLLVAQGCTALTAIIYYKKVSSGYWKWFAIYLVFIFFQEIACNLLSDSLGSYKENYYAFFGIPIQFLFLFWLYALKSLKKKLLFYSCAVLYLFSFLPVSQFFESSKMVYSFSYTIGTFLLVLLAFFEFYKQIKEDDILKFNQNKMFYINIGILFFYIGNLPFFGLYKLIVEFPEIWNAYYIYFLLSNCIMYVLFTASFIWGKQSY